MVGESKPGCRVIAAEDMESEQGVLGEGVEGNLYSLGPGYGGGVEVAFT